MTVALVYVLAGLLSMQTLGKPPQRPPTGVGRGGGDTKQAPARPMDSRTRSATGDALDRYLHGEYDKAIKGLGNLGGFDTLHAESWIISGGAAAVPKRRLAAALLALEYTASRPGLSPQLYGWAAGALRGTVDVPDEEETWLRAAIALAEGRAAWPLLMGVSPSLAGRPGYPESIGPVLGTGFLAYARSRFDANPRFKLASVVTLEAMNSPAPGAINVATTGKDLVSDQIDAQVFDRSRDDTARMVSPLQTAVDALKELRTDAIVGPEARVRLGFLQLRLGHRDLALQELTGIETSDHFVAYLSDLFRGWALAADGKTDDAVAAYRAAMTVVPHARSASALFAALCIQNGRLADAETAANDLMQKQAVGVDPWLVYLEGDYREYPALIAKLRDAIK